MIRFRQASLLIAVLLCLSSVPAFADTDFTDGTFNLANYSNTAVFSSGASVTTTQCAGCGDPGKALKIVVNYPTGIGSNASGYVNNTFSYDPETQGDILSITASVDKDLTTTFNTSSTSPFGNTFRPLIEQDGNYYLAAIPGPSLSSGMTTGYNLISQSGLVAADFLEFDFATDTFGTGNPNFDGDPMLFGLAQLGTLDVTTGRTEVIAEYDNLGLDLVTAPVGTPEPSSLLFLVLGLAGLIAISRKKLAINNDIA